MHIFLSHNLRMFLLVICRITGFTFGPHLEFWRKAFDLNFHLKLFVYFPEMTKKMFTKKP